jgi:hypothetical protein
MRNMPLKSLWKIVEHIKMDYEEWGGEPQIDETSLYRHVEEMLDLEREPPVSAPAEIVEQCVGEIVDITWSIIESTEPPTAADWARVSDIAEAQAAATRTARAAEIRTAANWAWVIFHDFFGEYPPTGDEDGYHALVHKVLGLRRLDVVEQLPPLS